MEKRSVQNILAIQYFQGNEDEYDLPKNNVWEWWRKSQEALYFGSLYIYKKVLSLSKYH